jgi:two-component system CheB/CheR fusion protein
VLSGNAHDGTAWFEIKQVGGLTFAQDDSAKFPSMPHRLLLREDFVLSPKEIGLEISRISKHPLANTKPIKNIPESK